MIKKFTILISLFFFLTHSAYASESCNTNPLVKSWIEERDNYALDVVSKWISGEGKDIVAPLLVSIWTTETKITTECVKDLDFLKRHRLIFRETELGLNIDTAPAFILYWILQNDFLLPERQYLTKK